MPKKTKKRRRLRKGRVTSFITICLVICGGILYSIQRYNNPTIYGTWISLETDKTVIFKRSGQVKLDNGQEATFEIISPNSRINYTVDGKHFDMNYLVDGRVLKWGLNAENMEVFERK